MYDQRTRDLDWQNAILAQAEEDGFEKGVERGQCSNCIGLFLILPR